MNAPIIVPENMLDAITAMLSPANPGLTKDDVRDLFDGSKTSSEESAVYTRHEVADRFKVSLSTIDRWLADGTLKKIMIGATVRITEAEIQRLLRPQAA
jgi:excisionase family DNA binding protein